MKKLSLPQVILKCKKMYYLTEIWFDSQSFMNEKQKFGWKDYMETNFDRNLYLRYAY